MVDSEPLRSDDLCGSLLADLFLAVGDWHLAVDLGDPVLLLLGRLDAAADADEVGHAAETLIARDGAQAVPFGAGLAADLGPLAAVEDVVRGAGAAGGV